MGDHRGMLEARRQAEPQNSYLLLGERMYDYFALDTVCTKQPGQ